LYVYQRVSEIGDWIPDESPQNHHRIDPNTSFANADPSLESHDGCTPNAPTFAFGLAGSWANVPWPGCDLDVA
jgi:hypothetical protein